MRKVETKVTIGEIYNKSVDFLKKKNVLKPEISVQLLLSDVLGKTKTEIFMAFDELMEQNQIDKMRQYLLRRAKQEPPQYILGYAYFYKYKFIVDKNVLIPRPETELLVDRAIYLIKDMMAGKKGKKLRIADLGCGSGNIAVSIAKEFGGRVEVLALDISAESLEVAKKNSAIHGVEKNIVFINESFDEFLAVEKNIDAILTNPPYISKEEYEMLPYEVKNFEPRISLLDKDNGCGYAMDIIKKSMDFLSRKFFLLMEIGWGQREFFEREFVKLGIENYSFIRDYNQIDRIIEIRSNLDG